MFTIRASFSDKFEVGVSIKKAHEFFSDIKNFVVLMPNVQSIHTNGDGTARWTIRAEIPFIGAMQESFNVKLAEEALERIEWMPGDGEKRNLLRYAADFNEKGANLTIVQFSQTVELRRDSARQFHLLAGLAGESRISREMQSAVAVMIRKFVQKAKEKLER